MPARRSSARKITKRGTPKAEAARLRVALVEAEKTLEMALTALRAHQTDYHHTSYHTTEMMEKVMVRVRASLTA